MRTNFYARELLGRRSCKSESDKPMLKKYGIIGLGLAVQHKIQKISSCYIKCRINCGKSLKQMSDC